MYDRTILENFKFSHLPEHLQAISRKFHDLAVDMDGSLPDQPYPFQKLMLMQRLLEAKDAAVRIAAQSGTNPAANR